MIECSFYNYNSESSFLSNSKCFTLVVKGHSALSYKGSDIVCAGVSVLVQTFIFSVSRDLEREVKTSGDTDLKIEVNSLDDDLLLIIKYMYNGLKLIERDYPDHLRIKTERI